MKRYTFLLLLLAGCIVESSQISPSASQTEILAAIEYKRKECGHSPDFPLIVPLDATAYGVELCSISIVRQKCPFREYPLFCLEMYNVDIPGIGP